MFIASTPDARGWNQWKEVSQAVKKKAEAFSILSQRFGRFRDESHKRSQETKDTTAGAKYIGEER